MFQHQDSLQQCSGPADMWLTRLIDRLEQAGQPELRAVPCDTAIVAACRLHLALPVAGLPRGRYLN